MNKNPELAIILTTTGNIESANRIAKSLVDEQVAACVQVEGPITSYYRWEGKVESSEEYRLVIKTTREQEGAVANMIFALHEYDLPQVVTIPVVGGLPSYLDWVQSEVKPADDF